MSDAKYRAYAKHFIIGLMYALFAMLMAASATMMVLGGLMIFGATQGDATWWAPVGLMAMAAIGIGVAYTILVAAIENM